MANTTIKDIARASGYSIKTVSRVVNRQSTVAKEIREKVEAVIAKMDYQPNVWARALRSSRSHLIALFSNDPTITYVNRIQLAAASICQQAGYHLMVEMLPSSERNLPRAIKDLAMSMHLDGVLLVPPCSDSLPFMKALSAAKVPFVRVSPYEHLDTASYVHIDDNRAAYDMTRYLIKLGHRDIAFVTGPERHTAAGQRFRGFEAAMQDHGIPINDNWIVPGQFDVQSGMQAGQALFSARKRPSAVLASNDDSAIGVMAAAYSRGVAIPRDVSIVGIDDAPIASSFWPKLTTVHQPVGDLGRVATEILIREIEAPGERTVEKLDCEIVVRESAGPPASAATAKRPRASHK
jgi:LacI family transcriptional regulator